MAYQVEAKVAGGRFLFGLEGTNMLLQYFPEYVTIKKFLDVTLVPDLESLSPQFRNLFALEPSHGFCCQQYVNVGQSKVAIARV